VTDWRNSHIVLRENRPSAIWGGATGGLVVGLILGLFVGTYWTTVLYAVLIGAASGLVAELLGKIHDRYATSDPTPHRQGEEETSEEFQSTYTDLLLQEVSPADFEASPLDREGVSNKSPSSKIKSCGASATTRWTRSTPRMKHDIPTSGSTAPSTGNLTYRSRSRLTSRAEPGRQPEQAKRSYGGSPSCATPASSVPPVSRSWPHGLVSMDEDVGERALTHDEVLKWLNDRLGMSVGFAVTAERGTTVEVMGVELPDYTS